MNILHFKTYYTHLLKFKEILQKVLKVKNVSSFHDPFNYNMTYTFFYIPFIILNT